MSRFAKIVKLDQRAVKTLTESYQLGHHDEITYAFKSERGLTAQMVTDLSRRKNEPDWMRELRLRAFGLYEMMPMPNFGGDLSPIKWEEIYYYLKPTEKAGKTWEEVPDAIKKTFEKIGVPQAEREMLAGVKAQYDCLTQDAMVFLKNGIKKIVDVKHGDEVYSLNEQTGLFDAQKVMGLADKGKRVVYKVITQGGREIRVTENHPFYSLVHKKEVGSSRGKYRKEWRYLSDLKVGDLIALAVDLPNWGKPYVLPKIDLPRRKVKSRNQFGEYDLDISNRYAQIKFPARTDENVMWLLGFYLGDGFRAGNSKRLGKDYTKVELAIPEQEEGLRVEVARIVKNIFDYKLLTSSKDRVTLNSMLFVKWFENLGLTGLAETKTIPDWIFSLPVTQRLAFVGGYFDADGGVSSGKNNGLVFTSVSISLLERLKLLAISCGLNVSHIWKFSSSQKYKGEKKTRGGFRLMISGDIKKVGSRLKRKLNLFRERAFVHRFQTAKGTTFKSHTSRQLGFVKMLSIERLGEEKVFDIEVSGHHNFVANGLVVHNSEVIYGSLRKNLAAKGVVFLGMDAGLAKYPELVKEYFSKIVPLGDNKLAALNSAVWSGGSFIYIPKNVEVELPLQAYFRINAENAGQFERTLIIADEGSKVHYVEGCSAPSYSSGSLHAAVVEIIVKKGARVQYTTVQNWYKNVYNLVTKRAYVEEEGEMRWIDGNLGSRLTMKFPCCILAGRKARGETLSIAMAGSGQHQDAGAKMIHLAPETTSQIISKSISKNGGRATYRGLVKINKGAKGARSKVVCDALILDSQSRSDTYPTNIILENEVSLEHEATVSKVGEDQLFYLMSRGLPEHEAEAMIVNGFLEPIMKQIPLEYAVEMNRLVELEMEGSVG